MALLPQNNLNTMPLPKITTLINDFILKTTTHLNKLSSSVENKLFQFDNRLKNLETMLGLLESKLNSLPPEITKGYPELIHISLNDVNPEILKLNPSANNNVNSNTDYNSRGADGNANPGMQNSAGNVTVDGAQAPKDEVKEVKREPTAQEKLAKFIEENEDITTYYNMLKFKIPTVAVRQKARFTSYRDYSLIEKLIEMYTEAHPYDVA